MIKQLRNNAGLTQEQLAEKLDTSKSMVAMLESGDRRLNTDWVDLLCKALNTSPDQIWGNSSQTKEDKISSLMDSVKQDFEHNPAIQSTLETLKHLVESDKK